MNPTIRVDDEVYAQLQARRSRSPIPPTPCFSGLPLGLDGSTHVASWPRTFGGRQDGRRKFVRLFAAVGRPRATSCSGSAATTGSASLLVWTRRGRSTWRTGPFTTALRGAARHLSGYEVSGWRVWRRSSDGLSLDDLIAQLRRARTPAAGSAGGAARSPASRGVRCAVRFIAQLRVFGGSADRAAVLAGVQSALVGSPWPCRCGSGLQRRTAVDGARHRGVPPTAARGPRERSRELEGVAATEAGCRNRSRGPRSHGQALRASGLPCSTDRFLLAPRVSLETPPRSRSPRSAHRARRVRPRALR